MRKLACMSGRMGKWFSQLSTYNLSYEPRSAIKSHTLVEFVVDFNPDLQPEVEKEFKWLQDT